jgi:hypothetical protein
MPIMPSRSHNPFGLCTWDDGADCDACGLRDKLHCRWDAGVLARFLVPASAFSVVAAFGVGLASYVTGAWGMLAAYLAFFVIFFLFVEIRILCSHCPYYGRDGFFLRCLANHGAPKFWRYRPQPMSRLERLGLLVGFAFYGGFPLAAQAYGIWYLVSPRGVGASVTVPGAVAVAAATLGTLLAFAAVLTIYFCPRCVNFSCPLNRVPPAVREEYRDRNPALRGEHPK